MGGSLTPSQGRKADKLINGAGELVTEQGSSSSHHFLPGSQSYFDPLGGSEHESEHESTNANKKKSHGASKRVSYNNDEMWKVSTCSRAPIDSIEEEIEMSGSYRRDEPTDAVSGDTTDSQSNENPDAPATTSSFRVTHTGDIEEMLSSQQNEP